MKAEIVFITPDAAQAMLERNPNNRPIRKRNLQAIEKAMAGGTWQVNGETIKIAPDGRVLDGQHRLTACVSTGVGFQSWVMWDVPTEFVATIDKGASRSVADFHAFHGEENPKSLAQAVNIICGLERRYHVAIPYEEQVLFLEKNPHLKQVVLERFWRRVRGITPGIEHACRYVIGHHYGQEEAKKWFQDFGAANYDEPQRLLALWLAKRRIVGKSKDTTIICANICVAAKMSFTGKPKQLDWRISEDPFPLSTEELYL